MTSPRGFFVLIVALLCCGAPLLLAALVATGASAWLAANRLFLGAGTALAVSLIAISLWIYQRKRMP